MLYLIGLGLGGSKDITIRGLEAAKRSDRLYLECYTSILSPRTDYAHEFEELFNKPLIFADRQMIEQGSDELLADADKVDVSLLVVGDPLSATTHCDLLLRAKERNIPVTVIHNASILTAVSVCGLQPYRFGETVSIVLWTDSWQPDSYYDKLLGNFTRGLHTLCLLDIKVREQSVENMMKKRDIYEPPRYMTVSEAAQQLLSISERRSAGGDGTADGVISGSTLCVGLARVGWDDQKIVACSLSRMTQLDLGPPLHSLIIPGDIQAFEREMLDLWKEPEDVACLK